MSGLGDAAGALATELSSIWIPVQLGIIFTAAVIAWAVALFVRTRTDLVTLTMGWPAPLRLLVRNVIANLAMIIFAALVAVLRVIMLTYTAPNRSALLGVAVSLAVAWVLIHIVAGIIRNRFVYRVVALSTWTIAALSILGLTGPVSDVLDSAAIEVGGLRLSPLLAVKTLVLLVLALWAALAIGNFLDERVRRSHDLTPSHQVLIGKLVRLALMGLAIVLVLRSAGIDLSALAIFSGAVGVGIGFGLQKIVSNFFSGIILLADKSIKPGDVITVGDSFGWVSTMSARFTAVITRDGREILIPNEDLVTHRVVNWSYTKDEIRLDLHFGVDISADPHVVRRVAVEAAASLGRVLAKPAPVCHFLEFSSRSLDFVLRFWINDPADGVTNIKGAVLLALWDALKREKIEFPSPVQELRLRQSAHVVVDNVEDAYRSGSGAGSGGPGRGASGGGASGRGGSGRGG